MSHLVEDLTGFARQRNAGSQARVGSKGWVPANYLTQTDSTQEPIVNTHGQEARWRMSPPDYAQ
jgi:hypothetical protein